jgi:hypothetical protein
LLTFVAAWTKVRRQAGRDPQVLLLVLKKDKAQQIINLLRSSPQKNKIKLLFAG